MTAEPPYVFVAYARPAEPIARAVVAALRAADIPAWWDGDLAAGEGIRASIAARVHGAALVVVIWSSGGARPWAHTEADIARGRNALLSVRLPGARVPEDMRGVATVDLAGAEPGDLATLVDACRRRFTGAAVEPLRRLGLLDVVLRKGANAVGFSGGLLVVGGWAIDPAGDLAPAWCDGLERALILFGVLVIAASPYLWPGANPEPPERFSRSVSAPAVAVAGCAASAQLALYGSVPDHVFHGLVMLALTGAFFRIQPRTVE